LSSRIKKVQPTQNGKPLTLLIMSKIKILIAEDYKLLAQSLKSSLNTLEEFEVIGVCYNSRETILDMDLYKPDILLLDLNMPIAGRDVPVATGFDVLENLKTNNSNTKSIIISNYNDYSLIKQSLVLGAKGYLLKNTSLDEISLAIMTVWKGGEYIQKEVQNNYQNKLKYYDEYDSFVNSVTLTKRQKEVLVFISQGFSSDEIAKFLKLQKVTVDEYRDNLNKKLKAKNSADLIRIAYESGLL
jgi:DNA-binding NarL/FixJ family response regulator